MKHLLGEEDRNGKGPKGVWLSAWKKAAGEAAYLFQTLLSVVLKAKKGKILLGQHLIQIQK